MQVVFKVSTHFMKRGASMLNMKFADCRQRTTAQREQAAFIEGQGAKMG